MSSPSQEVTGLLLAWGQGDGGALNRWQGRAHFFAVSARLMRRILVDLARSHHYQKRGAGARPVSFDENLVLGQHEAPDLVALDEALDSLASVDPRKCRVVELKFFVGLTAEEIAEVLKVSPQTVLRDWKLAKAWLRHEMKRGTHCDA